VIHHAADLPPLALLAALYAAGLVSGVAIGVRVALLAMQADG
jgi:hypothetical protein